MLAPGDTPDVPDLLDHNGETVEWKSFRGSPVVVFFYPKANTPGCTKEAIAFTELLPEFAELGVAVVGGSADSVKRQSNFVEKHSLGMPLLSDPDKLVLDAWGVWGEKKNYGKVYEGIRRSTFLFDADGAVVQVWENVRVKDHATKVLAAARALVTGAAGE